MEDIELSFTFAPMIHRIHVDDNIVYIDAVSHLVVAAQYFTSIFSKGLHFMAPTQTLFQIM